MATKRLYRSETDKMVAGICGGLAEYFDIDATVIRLFWLLITIFTGVFPGVIAYIIAIFIIPPAPHVRVEKSSEGPQHHPSA